MTILAAADGSALGNPGPAGWAWYADDEHWAAGGWPHGTNNQGELTAVLDLLEQTADVDDDVVIYCDSTYVIKSVTQWMPGWKRKGWKKGDGKPVMNVEIMKALDRAMAGRRVRFEWVKGHSGHELNEAADRLANGAATAYQKGSAPDPGPGWAGRETTPPARVAPTVTTPNPPAPDLFSELATEVDGAPVLTDEEQVIALERALLEDETRSDPAAVAALLHPQWSEIGRSGRLWTREEILDEIGPLGEEVGLDVITCMPAGPDTMLLTWRAVRDTESTLRSSLWVRRAGHWQQLFHQGTPEA
ncbi:ribonuclease HI family protein [Knoellia sp. Soil729]|uniref:ribonuclease HI family protein n=1 Tax=Knoellia sp. Soil729 TaxID=1736394 RepID=UPI0006F6C785|nr:ribonuclease HI family protein [Knoellia sp. Soil729]KRE43417.1 ribonuclease HI [Knoellia sp. Soil729]